jgi:hypothetical protein
VPCCMQFGDVTRLAGPSPQIYEYQQMSLAAYLDSLADTDPKFYAARLELQACSCIMLLCACPSKRARPAAQPQCWQ